MGGMIPYFAGKIKLGFRQIFFGAPERNPVAEDAGLKKPPLDYYKMLYADTALGEVAPTRCGHAFFGTGQCLFATDAPFDSEQGRGLMRNTIAAVNALEIPQARRMRFSGNAKKLLSLTPAMPATAQLAANVMDGGQARMTNASRNRCEPRTSKSNSATARWAPMSPIRTRRRPARSSPSWKSGASTTPCAITPRNLPRPASSASCPTCSGGRSRASNCPTSNPDHVQKAFDLYYEFDYDLGVRDMEDIWHYLEKIPECNGKVGAVGYCLGGKLCYLMCCRTDIDCAVAYYGTYIEHRIARRRTCTGRSCCTWR